MRWILVLVLLACGGPEEGPDLCAARTPLLSEDQADAGTPPAGCETQP